MKTRPCKGLPRAPKPHPVPSRIGEYSFSLMDKKPSLNQIRVRNQNGQALHCFTFVGRILNRSGQLISHLICHCQQPVNDQAPRPRREQ